MTVFLIIIFSISAISPLFCGNLLDYLDKVADREDDKENKKSKYPRIKSRFPKN
jgi:hypothetical protein